MQTNLAYYEKLKGQPTGLEIIKKQLHWKF